MPFEFERQKIKDVILVKPKVFGDKRGYFYESYSARTFKEHGLDYTFVQDNQSFSALKGTLRGIHFQKGDAAQAKLVRVNKGAVLDVAVDLRKGSPTYKKWVAVELSEENKRQLLIPRGFGHGFVTLTDDVEFLYKADNYYNAEQDRSILWCDEEIAVNWQVENPIISDKDASAPRLCDSDVDFKY